MKKLIAGNWKLNGSFEMAGTLISELKSAVSAGEGGPDILFCPPFPYLPYVRNLVDGARMAVGAQDCSAEQGGAFTGEVAPSMIADCGAAYVIVGHSERRQYHAETDERIAAKAAAAHQAGLIAIICVGETEAERDAGREEAVVGDQLSRAIPDGATPENTVLAYEPVWAIGTGKTASAEDVRKMHAFIRAKLQERVADSASLRILYGGSVKSANAAELMAVENVDGALVGGASLKSGEFAGIISAAG